MRTRRAFALALPQRIVPALGVTCAAFVALYVVLMVTTIFFAAWQTQLASSIEKNRVEIGRLEDQYYAAIASIDEGDASSLGLVAPARVMYVTEARMPGLTRADR